MLLSFVSAMKKKYAPRFFLIKVWLVVIPIMLLLTWFISLLELDKLTLNDDDDIGMFICPAILGIAWFYYSLSCARKHCDEDGKSFYSSLGVFLKQFFGVPILMLAGTLLILLAGMFLGELLKYLDPASWFD
jgi:hypothetical protein